MSTATVRPARAPVSPRPGDALLLVDLQNDFLPGGALGIADGDATIPVANRMAAIFRARGLPVFLSRDWHPPDHCSFRERGGPWPVHCVAGSPGAAFTTALDVPAGASVVSKATEAGREAYSALDGTGLMNRLQRNGITRLWVCGLATDYCVLATTLDARRAGLDVLVVRDGVCAVEARPGDGERALAAMAGAGASIVVSADVAAGA